MTEKDFRISLLSEDQIFGDDRLEIFRKTDLACSATDFALMQGARNWLLSSVAGLSDVAAVDSEGNRVVSYPNAGGGIRPVITDVDGPGGDFAGDADKSMIGTSTVRDGQTVIEYGEYPQTVAGRELSRKLEGEYASGRLRTTGKLFDEEYEEYIYKGNKYIRATFLSSTSETLSDGRTYKKDEPLWIEVEPIKWLVDGKAGLLVSERVVAFAEAFSDSNEYDGDLANTRTSRYLNTTFEKDMVPSVVKEMTAEEKAAYEEEARELEKKRNPYGLTFGETSEEEIIRGAIESDVAVFLHGPSSEGKSARVKQIDPTCEIIYLRNATPDSLNGRSVYNQSTGEMIDIPPTWYKKVKAKCEAEPDRFHVVFFDEINNALPSIQGMAFNIVLDREVNGLWKLPENARVVAAGNDMQDSLAANEIAAPFFNRFAHVYINTTTEKWLRWARDNDIHPAIYAFIAYRQGETLRSEYDGKKPNADPRKWEMASKMLYTTGRPEMLRALIGEEITDEFVRFCSQPVITLQKVLAGEYTEEDLKALNTSERYATVMGLSQAEPDDLKKVRSFTAKLGAEFRGLFDEIWPQGDQKRQEMLEDAVRADATEY